MLLLTHITCDEILVALMKAISAKPELSDSTFLFLDPMPGLLFIPLKDKIIDEGSSCLSAGLLTLRRAVHNSKKRERERKKEKALPLCERSFAFELDFQL